MTALEGVRIIDLTWSIAGPYCGQVLGDLGADVIRVEHPGRSLSERLNLSPPAWDGEKFSPYFIANNRNKRSLSLNLKSEDGRSVLADLVRVSDIVIENFGYDARESLVDETWAWEINPMIIWGSLTMLGRTGPEATKDGLDILVQARSGIADITGHPDGPPTKVGHSVCDYTAGSHLVIGLLAALVQRERIGRGQLVDISMLEPSVACLDGLPLWSSIAGLTPERVGNNHPAQIPGYKILPASDGHIAAIGVGPPFDVFVAEGLERPDLSPLPMPWEDGYQDVADEVAALFAEWVAVRTRAEAKQALDAVGIMNEPVKNLSEIWSDSQLEARGAFVDYEYPSLGQIRAIASPMHLSESPREVRHVPPGAGEHNEEILRDLLGYDDATVTRLHENGSLWDWE
jgi:crotonobetainyl-CoA:carnitine CoA-transferase CaiB-like acyl-CoA transferase